jgi:3'(2'), 5'-bisphosphate nucleotidase
MSALGLPLEVLLGEMRNIAREAGDAVMEVYGTAFSTVEKIDRSPLTEADLAAHRIISRRLRELTPELPLLSEEGREVGFAERRGWANYWLVDPLDGTREFVKRNGEFTVNIALIQGHTPLLGVVWSPVLERLYSGGRGLGAFRESGVSSRVSIQVQRTGPTGLPRVVGSRSHGNARLQGALQRLGPHELVAMGSSLKLCLVAEGAADLYPRLGPPASGTRRRATRWSTLPAAGWSICTGRSFATTPGNPCSTRSSWSAPGIRCAGCIDSDWIRTRTESAGQAPPSAPKRCKMRLRCTLMGHHVRITRIEPPGSSILGPNGSNAPWVSPFCARGALLRIPVLPATFHADGHPARSAGDGAIFPSAKGSCVSGAREPGDDRRPGHLDIPSPFLAHFLL